MIIPLSELKRGQKATLKSIDSPFLELKMLELGFVEGVPLSVVEIAPFGDPMIIKNTSTQLILRKSETSKIQIEPQI